MNFWGSDTLMRILIVSRDFSSADLAYRLKQEGNDVRVWIKEKNEARAYQGGMLQRVKSWKKALLWVRKSGLVVFDSTGFGKIQGELRAKGYSVVGGSEYGDRCEDDRAYGQKVLWNCGMKMVPYQDFKSLDEAIAFVKKHPKEWVIKQNGHASKIFNYVGSLKDGSDVISVLESYRKTVLKRDLKGIQLQERIRGIEIGIGRYFNGTTWVGPIEMNVEHKNLDNGDLGPKTFEMGTLMWFDKNEKNPLYQETLAKMEVYLRKINFRGDIDVNCIVNETGVYPLEITARFGYPAVQLQMSLSQSNWSEFLKAVADGESYDFQYKKGEYGVIVLVAVPPFPYANSIQNTKPLNLNIYLKDTLTEEDMKHIHFEEVSKRKNGQYYVSGPNGFVLHVSGTGKSIEAARKQAYGIIQNIIIPKMFYRTDIGLKFEHEERKQLKKWGYIK